MKLKEALKAKEYKWPRDADFIVCDKDGHCWPSVNEKGHKPFIEMGQWDSSFLFGYDFHLEEDIEDWECVLTKEEWEKE